MKYPNLFPDIMINDDEILYVIGNGFDIHHGIDSRYTDFKNWLQRKKRDSRLTTLMDIFFSNESDFWSDIETALGEYRKDDITAYCEPENPADFKYNHPGQWQAGVEDSISYVFGSAMDDFRSYFNHWVMSIDIEGSEPDMQLSKDSRYLTFNYTDTLETIYGIPPKNVLHIHGNRLMPDSEFIIGHGNHQNADDPYGDDGILLPYQNAYSEVISIMNQWTKDCMSIIEKNKEFFLSLNTCHAVKVMGYSYNEIDMPYIKEIAQSVAEDCRWLLYFYSQDDRSKAESMAIELGLKNYCLIDFD